MALLSQLRNNFKIDGRIYRVFPSGEVQYLHPKVRSPSHQPIESGYRRTGSRGCSGRRTRAFEYSLEFISGASRRRWFQAAAVSTLVDAVLFGGRRAAVFRRTEQQQMENRGPGDRQSDLPETEC